MKVEEIDYSEILELRQTVMYPDKDIDFVKLEDDELGIHMGIREKGTVVSAMSIFLNGRELQFRKLATKQEFQKQGYASALIKWLIYYASEMKFDKVWANARTEALPFYKRLDFKETDKTFSKNGYDYVVIEYLIK